jgi:hypothetical protein
MYIRIITNLKTLYHAKLVNYILDESQENVLTSSAAANEVSARIELLQDAQFIVDNSRSVGAKTIQNCFVHCGFKHTRLLRCRIRRTVKMTSLWRSTTSQITKFL